MPKQEIIKDGDIPIPICNPPSVLFWYNMVLSITQSGRI